MPTVDTIGRATARRLVVSMDVGTTFSGIAYCIIEPGEKTKIRTVTRFPGQSQRAESAKIPTVLYYDSDGRVKAAGAETTLPNVVDEAEDENWLKVEWFKLHLRPETLPSKLRALPPLPAGKTVVEVFADFLVYLFSCAEKFIKDTNPALTKSWSELRANAVFVLAHPNGWEGAQQTKMRTAAVEAGLVPDDAKGHSRVVFVTEGEASLHYCIVGDFIDESERRFIIADLGGGTLDFSAYRVLKTRPLEIKEMDVPKCFLEGSVLVSQRAHVHLRKKLEGSRYGDPRVLDQISGKFDETTKKVYEGPDEGNCQIPFGSITENEPSVGIRNGKLRISSKDVATFFEPSITSTVDAIDDYIRKSSMRISAIYLVGGFSVSPYLQSELRKRLQDRRITIASPDDQVLKPVANGAITFYVDHFVKWRTAKVTYGARIWRTFDENDPEHRERRSKVTYAYGRKIIDNGFRAIVTKGTLVPEETDFRCQLVQSMLKDAGTDLNICDEIYAFRGDEETPNWFDQVDEKRLKPLFNVSATVSRSKGAVPDVKDDPSSPSHVMLFYEIHLFFGGPELRAQISWKEKGKEVFGPAQIFYET